jgi:probable HAF family extracellular repeat protein
MAENGDVDPSCPPNTTNNRIQLPVLWENGKVLALPTVDGDPDGIAFWINDHGQAVGRSGTCNGAILHAVSWENRTATKLADFGTGAFAFGNNNQGQIVGTVGTADNSTQTGALWQNSALTTFDLLPGDFGGIASGINSQGQVVGGNWDSNFSWSHGYIWQNGVTTDLNTLFPASSNLCATFAAKINDRGQIGGQAIVLSGPHAGNVHAFLATPVKESVGKSVADVAPKCPASRSPADASKQLLPRVGLLQFVR